MTPILRLVPSSQTRSMWIGAWAVGLVAAVILIGLLLPAAAVGQTAVPDPDDLGAFLRAFLDAPVIGKVVLGLIGAVYLLRKVGTKLPKVGPFLSTSEGGTLVLLVSSAVAYVGAAYFGGVPISLAVVGKALSAAIVAGGGWTVARRLLRLIVPLVASIPRVGPTLAALLDVLSGADTKAEILRVTERQYVTLSPAPTAQQAADALSKPPVP